MAKSMLPLPGQPNECAVTSNGRFLAVPLLAPNNSVVIYDLTTKALVKTLPLRHPHNCFVPEGGSNTAIWCEERDLYRINRIDLNKLDYTDFVNVGGDPRPFIVMPDEKTLYTALSGVGYLIARTAATYRVDRMFVPIVTLGLLGVTLTALLRLIEKYLAPWTNASDEN